MKIRDIRENSIVQYKGSVYRVVGVAGDNLILSAVDQANAVDAPLYVDAGRCEPVPLTDKMIESNGFERSQGEYIHWRLPQSNDIEIRKQKPYLLEYEAMLADVPVKVRYVHELQRALVFATLTELAYNFKAL